MARRRVWRVCLSGGLRRCMVRMVRTTTCLCLVTRGRMRRGKRRRREEEEEEEEEQKEEEEKRK
jgi:hypothetical protein